MPGENGRAAKVERLLKGAKEEKKEIAGNMAGYKDSGGEWIGAIPKGWSVNKGKYIFNQAKKKPVYDTDEIITCFRDGEVTLRKNRRTDGFTMSDKEIGYQGIDKGDLIIHGMDGFAGAIGISDSRGKASPVLMVLDTKQIKSYMKYHLRAMASSGAIAALTTGIRVRSCDLRFSKLENILFAIPPLPEQQRIADFLDTKCGILDRTIDAVSRQIEDLEKYKKALITKTVTKGICKKGKPERAMKDSGVEWIGEDIPFDWDINRLQFCIDEISERNYAGKETHILSLMKDKGVIPYEEKGRVGNISKTDLTQYKLAYPNTLITNSMNIIIGSSGISQYKGCVSPAYYVFKAKPNNDIRYFNYIFAVRAFQNECRRFANGILEIRLRISSTNLLKIKVPVPSPEEQQQIADYLDEKCKNIDNRVQKRRQQLEWLKKYKKSLIFDYVTGKKRV